MSSQCNLVKKREGYPEVARQYQVVTPQVDIYENEDEIVLHADMPGVAKEDFSIEINDGKLFIGGSRKLESNRAAGGLEVDNSDFKRIFSVPPTIDAEKVSASLENGVLHLHLPKSEGAKPRQIKIETK